MRWILGWYDATFVTLGRGECKFSDILDSVVEAIGKTPLVRLDRLTKRVGVKGTILAKLEYLNPGFSKKDRPALGIIEEAERTGDLRPGQPVVELTLGNMGGHERGGRTAELMAA